MRGHRLFVALRPPPPVRAALLELADGLPGARWQDDEQLHLTLRFLGEVQTPVAEDVAAALSRIAGPAPVVAVAGAGAFDRRGAIDTLWTGIHADAALSALHREVAQAVAHAGLPPEQRRFHPHVTIARFGRRGADPVAVSRWIERHAALALPPFAAGHLYLYESRLGSEGARYEAVARWPLDPPT